MFFYNNIWYIFISCKWLSLIYLVRLNSPLPHLIPRINNKWWRLRLLLNPYSGAFICYLTRGAGFVCFLLYENMYWYLTNVYTIDYNIWCCIRLLSITRGCVFVYCSSSVGTIAGAVIGGLFALAVVIGIIVFICVVVCKCKTTGVRGRVVQPGVGVSNNVTYINSPSAPPYNSKSFDFCLVFAILYFLDMFELSIPLNNI